MQRVSLGTQTLLQKAQPFVESASASLLTKAQPISPDQNLASVFVTLITNAFALLRAYLLAAAVGLRSFASAGIAKFR